MSILRFGSDPFDSMMRLQRALSQSLDRPFFGLDWSPSGRGLFPSLNILEEKDGDAIVVKAEIPGIDRENLEVEALGNRLVIAGTRTIKDPDKPFRYHRRERKSGDFRRVFRLPFEVNRDKATASYQNGVLTVRLEKAEAAKPRQIAIKG